ncbi:MAG: hypothetical protein WCO56_07270 [Verrucomicrobiota bacterium]
MNHIHPKHFRILGIAPTARGVGFAVLEGQETLVDWGVKTVKGDKNAQSLAKVEKLIAHYQPEVLVLPDTSAKNSRRYPRIQKLSQQIVKVATARNIRVVLLSAEKLRRVYFGNAHGTKHALAEIIAKRFPDELGSFLPPKRKPWMSEHYQMDIFDAVALVVALRIKKTI